MGQYINHLGIPPDELLDGSTLKEDIERVMPVWGEILRRISDPDDVGGIEIPGSPLHQHAKGARGVQFTVNRGPSLAHVDPERGFLFGLHPETDSIQVRGARPVAENAYSLWTGIRNPSRDRVESFEHLLGRARVDLVKGERKDRFVWLVNETAQMNMAAAINLFLMVRVSGGSHVQKAFDNWSPAKGTCWDELADWIQVVSELSVFIPAWMRRKYRNLDFIEPEEHEPYTEAFVRALGFYSSEEERLEQNRVFNRLANNMPYHDPPNLSTFSGRVTGSGGPSPYFVYNASLSALWGRDHGAAAPFAGSQMLTAISQLGVDARVDTIQRWWRQWIAENRVAIAVGHAYLRGEEGDPRNRGLLGDLEDLYGGSDLLEFAKEFYRLGIEEVTGTKSLGFANVNVDGNTWIAMVLSGLLALEPDEVEGAFAPFAAIRSVGVAKEDFWGRNPKRTILRPSPIHWWALAPSLIKCLPDWMLD